MILKDNVLPKCPECGDIENDGVKVRAIKGGREAEIYCRTHNIDIGTLQAVCSSCFPFMRKKYARIKTSPNNDLMFMFCFKHVNHERAPGITTPLEFDELCKAQLEGNK